MKNLTGSKIGAYVGRQIDPCPIKSVVHPKDWDGDLTNQGDTDADCECKLKKPEVRVRFNKR